VPEQPAIDLKLAALFERAARSLAAYEGSEVHDHMRCPLCLEYFDRGAVAAGILTREHIVPRKVGGRLETITGPMRDRPTA
jgi:hypothetical protein